MLLNIDANAKTVKGQTKGYMTAILYLAPSDLSGYQVCPMASEGCIASCLNTAGMGVFTKVQAARIRKTKLFFEDRIGFMKQLDKEISAFVRKAKRKGLVPCVRLNGTSDIVWERVPSPRNLPNIMAGYPDLQFYDYTKRANRKDLPVNYTLTFSLSEDNEESATKAFENGMNVAIVYRRDLPRYDCPGMAGTARVIDGTMHDLRFLDDRGVIVGLCAKGRARYDTSGFVRD